MLPTKIELLLRRFVLDVATRGLVYDSMLKEAWRAGSTQHREQRARLMHNQLSFLEIFLPLSRLVSFACFHYTAMERQDDAVRDIRVKHWIMQQGYIGIPSGFFFYYCRRRQFVCGTTKTHERAHIFFLFLAWRAKLNLEYFVIIHVFIFMLGARVFSHRNGRYFFSFQFSIRHLPTLNRHSRSEVAGWH